MDEETKKAFEEATKALAEYRETVEKSGADSAEAKQKAENVEKTLADQEEKNAKVVGELAESQKAVAEMEERMKDLEAEVVNLSSKAGEKDYKEMPEYKALETWAKRGDKGLSDEETKLLRTDNNVQGGYLTMPEMDTMMIKEITEISPVRQVSRVKTVGSKTLEIPTRTGIPTANFEGEAEQDELDNSTYGNETLTAYRQGVTIPFTMDMLMDSRFNLEAEIRQDVSEAFAQGEGRAFVLGTGAKQPEGFLSTAANITNTGGNVEDVGQVRPSGAAATFTGDNLIQLTGDLKVGYNPMYAFNRRTLAFIRTLKDTAGQYVFQLGAPGLTVTSLAGAAPNTIAGEPYVLFEDMPDIAANAFPVIYGDFMRGYCIVDRAGMSMVRDELTRKRNAIVEITFHRWLHGQVVLREAFKVLRCAVS